LADFFDVEHYPQVRFVSDMAVVEGDTLKGTRAAARRRQAHPA